MTVYFLFFLCTLAVWRISHLLSKEEGPFNIIYLVRKKAGAGFFGSLLDCFYCVSVWVSLPIGIWLGSFWWEKILYWLALSGAACLIEQGTDRKNNDHKKTFYEED
jgi:hypothetical protein